MKVEHASCFQVACIFLSQKN